MALVAEKGTWKRWVCWFVGHGADAGGWWCGFAVTFRCERCGRTEISEVTEALSSGVVIVTEEMELKQVRLSDLVDKSRGRPFKDPVQVYPGDPEDGDE